MFSNIDSTVHLFQTALAPAFLLTGTGAILSILSSRLAGVLEKCRNLNQLIKEKADLTYQEELDLLDKCCILLYRAFVLCLLSAFFTCLVITFIFAGQFLPDSIASGVMVSVLFTASMLCLTVSVFLLLYETIIGKKLLFFVTRLGHQIK